jgi:hypothetical protein
MCDKLAMIEKSRVEFETKLNQIYSGCWDYDENNNVVVTRPDGTQEYLSDIQNRLPEQQRTKREKLLKHNRVKAAKKARGGSLPWCITKCTFKVLWKIVKIVAKVLFWTVVTVLGIIGLLLVAGEVLQRANEKANRRELLQRMLDEMNDPYRRYDSQQIGRIVELLER